MPELDITTEIPLFSRAFDVVEYFLSSGIEMRPVGLGIKWESLEGLSVIEAVP